MLLEQVWKDLLMICTIFICSYEYHSLRNKMFLEFATLKGKENIAETLSPVLKHKRVYLI